MAASIVSIVLINERTIKRNNLLSNAMQNSSDGMIITNEKNEIIEINESIQEIYGYKEEELIGQNPKKYSLQIYMKKIFIKNVG